MSRQNRRYLLLAAILFILGGLRIALSADPISDVARQLSLPISSRLQSVVVSPGIDIDERLQLETVLLQQQLEQLRAEVGLDGETIEGVVAEVVQRDVSGQRKSLWINKGADDGVRSGAAVTNSGFLIGRIITTGRDWSEIVIFGDPSYKVSARAGNANGIISGQQGSTIFSLVPEEQLEGEPVFSDGIDGLTPPNLPIGVVGSLINGADGVFRDYTMRLGLNPNEASVVTVLNTVR